MPADVIPRIEQIYPGYQWTVNTEPPPFSRLTKPLSRCRVALISSGGVYHQDQEPFDVEGKGDQTFREIPKDVDVRDLRVIHKGYNTTDTERDVNCVFPIERFRELEAAGVIGELASPTYTFMGRVFSRKALQKEMAPALAEKLVAAGVDIFYLVPI